MNFKNVSPVPFDVEKAIRARISTRSYEEKSLTPEDKAALLNFFDTQSNPFGVDVHVQYLSKESGVNNVQLGTYGTIKGAKDFLAITVKEQPFFMEAVGYQFENFILKATDMGLGTVWLAGTFSRKDFAKNMDLQPEDIFPCICPIGYPGGKRSLMDKFIRTAAGSKNRKSWEKIFFENDISHPLSEAAAGAYKNPLEMLRLAPSATNSQPWVVIKEENRFRFFNVYKSNATLDVERIKHLDLGIALSHFHQTALQNQLSGFFEVEDKTFNVPEDWHYVLSYVAQ